MNEMCCQSIRAHLLIELGRETPRSYAEAVVRRIKIERLRRDLRGAEAHRDAVPAWPVGRRPMLPAAAPWGTR